MELMKRRRELMQGGKLDTSPKILQYDATYLANGSIDTTEVSQGYCVTDKYAYPTIENTAGTIAFYGTYSKIALVYKNGGSEKMDYWTLANAGSPRQCLNAGSDAIAFTLAMSTLDDSYCYIVDTGVILFAGKNTIYYGYKNINDMPT